MTSDVKLMDKKSQKTSEKVESSDSGKKVISFVGDIKQEFGKITWTDREELKAYTKIVVGTTFLFGMAIYFIDLMIQGALNAFGAFVHLIGG